MEDRTFKPAGLMMTAIVAGLAPGVYAEAPQAVKQSPAAKEHAARETLIAAAAKFAPAEPFAPKPRETDVPLGSQLDLFD